MGNAMRCHCLPAPDSEEPPYPDCDPERIMLLGEEFVAFRRQRNPMHLSRLEIRGRRHGSGAVRHHAAPRIEAEEAAELGAAIRAVIEARGASPLPLPYSPDFNPIEALMPDSNRACAKPPGPPKPPKPRSPTPWVPYPTEIPSRRRCLRGAVFQRHQ